MVLVHKRAWIVLLLSIQGIIVGCESTDLSVGVPKVFVKEEAHPSCADICHECSGWCAVCVCCIIFASNIPPLVTAQPESATCPISSVVSPLVPSMDDMKSYQPLNKSVSHSKKNCEYLRKRR